jgi:hypothetical protein
MPIGGPGDYLHSELRANPEANSSRTRGDTSKTCCFSTQLLWFQDRIGSSSEISINIEPI